VVLIAGVVIKGLGAAVVEPVVVVGGFQGFPSRVGGGLANGGLLGKNDIVYVGVR